MFLSAGIFYTISRVLLQGEFSAQGEAKREIDIVERMMSRSSLSVPYESPFPPSWD
jgi:hypothetical protein